MADQRTAPYQVLQRDAKAHVVFDRASRVWGGVFSGEQEVDLRSAGDPDLPVKKVWQPCLLMAQQTGRNAWQISLADPDLNPGKNGISQPKTVQLLLPDKWRFPDAPGNIKLEPAADGDSLLIAECREGRSYCFALLKE